MPRHGPAQKALLPLGLVRGFLPCAAVVVAAAHAATIVLAVAAPLPPMLPSHLSDSPYDGIVVLRLQISLVLDPAVMGLCSHDVQCMRRLVVKDLRRRCGVLCFLSRPTSSVVAVAAASKSPIPPPKLPLSQ